MTATAVPPPATLAGTSSHLAAAAYGTPSLMPVTVPDPPESSAVVAGTCGIGSDGSRMPAVRMVSPVATPASSVLLHLGCCPPGNRQHTERERREGRDPRRVPTDLGQQRRGRP